MKPKIIKSNLNNHLNNSDNTTDNSKKLNNSDNLIGELVVKMFKNEHNEEYDNYIGTIISFKKPFYTVKYEDGDTEELKINQINKILLTKGGKKKKNKSKKNLLPKSRKSKKNKQGKNKT
jgi:hypothetical protein